MDNTLIRTSSQTQNRPGSNDNEGLLHTLQSSRTGASPIDAV